MTFTGLRLSLLAALCLHLLAMAGWQILRNQQAPVSRLEARDDTPILLQFSRQAPLTQEQSPIPLPPAAPLPLPLGGQPTGSTSPIPPVAGSLIRGQTLSTGGPRQAASAKQGTQTPAHGSRSGGRADIRPRSPLANEVSIRTIPALLALGPGSPARKALSKMLHEVGSGHQGEAREAAKADGTTEAGADGMDPASLSTTANLSRAKGATSVEIKPTAADTRLWAIARPLRTPLNGLEGLPESLSIRQIPLRKARRSGADLSHQRMVRLEDESMLLWIDAGTLWLLRVSLP